MGQKEWYAAVGKKKAGPYEAERIAEKIAAGKLGKALFWKGGMDRWVPAAEVPVFQEARSNFENKSAARKRKADLKQKKSRIKEARQRKPSGKSRTTRKRKSAGPPPLAAGGPPPLAEAPAKKKTKSRRKKAAGGPPPLSAGGPPPLAAPAAEPSAKPSGGGAPKASKPLNKGLVYLQIFFCLMLGLYFGGQTLIGLAAMAPADGSSGSDAEVAAADGELANLADAYTLVDEAELVDFETLSSTSAYAGKVIMIEAWWNDYDGERILAEKYETTETASLTLHPDADASSLWLVDSQNAQFFVYVPEDFEGFGGVLVGYQLEEDDWTLHTVWP